MIDLLLLWIYKLQLLSIIISNHFCKNFFQQWTYGNEEINTQKIKVGDYILSVSHDYTWAWSSGAKDAKQWPRVGGIIISVGPDEYIIAGTGIIVTFAPNSPGDPIAGIASIQEGKYENDRWIGGRWMNGDQSHQGRHLRLPPDSFGIQRVKLYRCC